MDVELIITFCFSLLRLATPIVYAALAASVCYKASVDNMAIESMMPVSYTHLTLPTNREV